MDIHCHCGKEFTANFSAEYDLDAELSLKEQILAGDFLTVTCPACENLLKIEAAVRLNYPSRQQVLMFYPDQERDSFLVGALKPPTGVTRLVFGYKELVEKVRLFEAGLDDRVVEVLKASFLQNQHNPDLVMYFQKIDQDKLNFFLEGLKDHEIGLTSAPLSAYLALVDRVNKNPPTYWEDFKSGYVHLSGLIQ